MGNTALVWDETFARHDPGPGRPERPERLHAIRRAIQATGLDRQCTIIPPRPADMETLSRVHDPAYVQALLKAIKAGARLVDSGDTGVCPASFEVASMAVGAVLDAVDAVMAGQSRNAFCAIRPPGHHAERDAAMGFCLFNNVALAADHLLRTHGLERVFILDWDVHHGNGAQHIFERSPKVFICSLHGHPKFLYPGTGWPEERGLGEGEGYTLNVPLEPGAGDAEYRQALEESVLPAIDGYSPQFLLISAGFDAHRLDPLAPLMAEVSTFEWMTERVLEAADRHCAGRLVSLLEGGYHLEALGECVSMHLALLVNSSDRYARAGKTERGEP